MGCLHLEPSDMFGVELGRSTSSGVEVDKLVQESLILQLTGLRRMVLAEARSERTPRSSIEAPWEDGAGDLMLYMCSLWIMSDRLLSSLDYRLCDRYTRFMTLEIMKM